jgi:hypothetical protein
MTAATRFFAKRPGPNLFVTLHALIVERIHAVRQRRGVRIIVTGIARGLRTVGLARKQFVTLVAAFKFLLVHVGVAALALDVDSVAKRRRVSIGLFAVTLVARARLGLYVRVVVTVGATRSVLLRVVVMTVGEFAQLGMVTLGTGLSRQILLVIGGELRIELRCMAGTARQRGQGRDVTLVVTSDTISTHFFHVLHVA